MTYDITYRDRKGFTHTCQVRADNVRQAIKEAHGIYPEAYITRAMPAD